MTLLADATRGLLVGGPVARPASRRCSRVAFTARFAPLAVPRSAVGVSTRQRVQRPSASNGPAHPTAQRIQR